MSQLVETDVCEDRCGHEEDKRCIKQDQTSLANVGVVKKHEARGCHASGEGVTRLPHDEEDGGNGKRAERGGHRTVCDVGNVVGDVGVADVLEKELAFVANNPSCKGEQQLSKRRVDIEEVCTLQVV